MLGATEKVEDVVPCGNANWATTAKITTRMPDRTIKEYFLKIVRGELAEERVIGEFDCMSELYRTVPSIVPMPYGAGKCIDTKGCFFLSEYVPIVHHAPDAVELGNQIARLHRESCSPTGKFGFSTTPYDGKLPLVVDWDSSWVSFYSKLLYGVYLLDTRANGKVRISLILIPFSYHRKTDFDVVECVRRGHGEHFSSRNPPTSGSP